MKAVRSRSLVVGVIALVAIGSAWLAAWRLNVDPEPGRLVHAGPRTTVITEPLRADGSVDYVAWARERLHEGVTADNDLAPVISLCLANPVRGVPPAANLERPPAPLVEWESWCFEHPLDAPSKDPKDADADADVDTVDPVWAAAESWAACNRDGPHAAEMRTWLESIGPALDLIASESKRRERWFEQLDERGPTAIGRAVSMRVVLPAFFARAIGRAMDGNLAGASEDLECAKQLGMSRSPLDDFIEVMTRQSFERQWQIARQSIAEHFTGFRCADFRSLEGSGWRFDLEKEVASTQRVSRIQCLTFTFLTIRDWPALLSDQPFGIGHPPAPASPPTRKEPPSPNLRASETDRFLESLNSRLDLLDGALTSASDWRMRIADLRRLSARFQAESQRGFTFYWDFWRQDRPPDEEIRRAPDRVASTIASLEAPVRARMLAEIVTRTADADRARVLCAIACFRNEHGRPPATIDELVPACFDSPPLDRICHRPMKLTLGSDGKPDVTSEALTLAAGIEADWKAYSHQK